MRKYVAKTVHLKFAYRLSWCSELITEETPRDFLTINKEEVNCKLCISRYKSTTGKTMCSNNRLILKDSI